VTLIQLLKSRFESFSQAFLYFTILTTSLLKTFDEFVFIATDSSLLKILLKEISGFFKTSGMPQYLIQKFRLFLEERGAFTRIFGRVGGNFTQLFS
jgi:hypothetical protein